MCRTPPPRSLFEEFRVLVLRCQLQGFLLLHEAVPAHRAQVASVDRQQHHRGGKRPVAEVSQAPSRHHDDEEEEEEEEDPKRDQEQVQQQNTGLSLMIWGLL